jgi:hypothetical protein
LSRNQDRLGGVQQHDTAPPPQTMNDNGFSFVVPTEFVELPSEGKYYPEGHPLCGQTSLEIKQMTAKEEDMLTSRTLLKKGVALDRVLASVITDKSIDPDSLFIGDRNAIIVATRVSGYGNIYSTNVSCPACSETQEYSFDLNDADVYTGGDSELNITNNNDGTFDIVLPRTGITATFRLLNGYDEKKISSGAELDKKQKVERNVTRQLSSMLVAANGDTSAQAINYLVDNLPSVDSRHLRLAYRETAPNIDLTQNFECSACGHEQDMEVPLSADFFWPDR